MKKDKAGQNHQHPLRRFLLAYTLGFALLFGVILYLFGSEGRSLIYHSDAWRQHIRALAYYGEWLRGIVYNLVVGHTLKIETWSFGLGYGGDIVTTLQYYCIGEPLTVLAVFVPEEYTVYLFQALMVVRPYLAGLAFTAYAEYLLRRRYDAAPSSAGGRGSLQGVGPSARSNDAAAPTFAGSSSVSRTTAYTALGPDAAARLRTAAPCGQQPASAACGIGGRTFLPVLAGALCYVFSGTVLYIGMLHPYFVTPMIWFPLILLGIEHVLREGRPGILMVSVCLAALSNFYFLYQLMLLAAGYALIRVTFRSRKIREWLRSLARLLGYVLTGIAGGGCILVPILVQFSTDPRSSTSYSAALFYDADYYSELLTNLVSFINHPQYDTELCMAILAVGAVVLLFFLKGRGYAQLKTAVLGVMLMLCLPAAGFVLNGFSYVINRWTYGAEMLIALILVVVWSDALQGKCAFLWKRPSISRTGSSEGDNSAESAENDSETGNCRRGQDASGTSESLIADTEHSDIQTEQKTAYPGRCGRWISMLLFAAAAVNLVYNIYIAFEPGGFTSEFVKAMTPEEYYESAHTNEASAIAASYGTEEFYRYTGRDLTWNASLSEGISSTQFCWSLANGTVSDYFMALGNRDEQNFAYYALDDRIILNALAGVKYYVLSEWDSSWENTHAMYGYVDAGLIDADAGASPEKTSDENPDADASDAAGDAGGTSDIAADAGNVLADSEDSDAAAAADLTVSVIETAEEKDSWESSVEAYHVYENAFALPLGYTYTETISRSDFDELSMTERQEALLQAVVLEDEAAETASADGLAETSADSLSYYEEEIAFTLSCSDGVSVSSSTGEPAASDPEGTASTEDSGMEDGSASGSTGAGNSGEAVTGMEDVVFTVTQAGAAVTLDFAGLADSETYFAMTNLSVAGLTAADTQEQYAIEFKAYSGADELADKTLNYKTAQSQYYSGWTDFVINLGYSSVQKTSLTITFPAAGVYTMDELRVICQPMVDIMSNVALRLASILTDVDLGKNTISQATNTITGTITAEQTRFLLLNIPYSTGWKAYVDGEEVDLEKANLMFLGLTIEPGEHEIALVYYTPGSKAGLLCSAGGLILMMLLMRRRRRV